MNKKAISITLFLILAVIITVLAGFFLLTPVEHGKEPSAVADGSTVRATATPIPFAWDIKDHNDMLVDAFTNSQAVSNLLTELAPQRPQYDYGGIMILGEGIALYTLEDNIVFLYERPGITLSPIDVFVVDMQGNSTITTLPSTYTGLYTIDKPISDIAAVLAVGFWAQYEKTVGDGYLNMDGYYTPLRPYIDPATPVVDLPPDPVKDGHTFTGWYFDEACTLPYDGSPIYSDTTLYAGWEINTRVVTFDSMGGSDVPSQTIDWNTVPELPTPTREGYIFKCWLLDGNAYTGAGIRVNTTLTASWQPKTYEVSFNVNGSNAGVPSLWVEFGTVPTLPIPTRTGYDFVGWYLNGEPYNSEPITGETRFTAEWEIKKYTVTFVVDGAEYRTLEVDYGTALTDLLEQNGIAGYSLLDTQGEIVGADAIVDGNGAFTAIQETAEDGTNTVLQFFKDVWAHIKANYIAISLSVIGAVVLMIIGAVFTKKRRG